MDIQFYKRKDGMIVMTITRDDGSATWTKLRRGIEDHDLAHYAVEYCLGMKKAFLGLVNEGADISDFEDKERQPEISIEAQQAEHLVNLLQTEYWNNGGPIDIIPMLSDIMISKNIPMIENLNANTLSEIRTAYRANVAKLNALEAGDRLRLKLDMSCT